MQFDIDTYDDCKYCDTSSVEQLPIIKANESTFIVRNSAGFYTIDTIKDMGPDIIHEGSEPIRFCPMCGRRL